MTILKNALLGGTLCNIVIEKGTITAVYQARNEQGMDLFGRTVIPGLVDVHIHGCGGYSVMDGELQQMSRFLAHHGTTSFLPTTMTEPVEHIKQALSADTNLCAASFCGFHLEGPYLAPSRRGAHREDLIQTPEECPFSSFQKVAKLTVAPELPGSMQLIAQADCQISLGHTECTYQTAIEAIKLGATSVTHLYNAMPPLLHRAPGLIGAALEHNLYAELICDGLHVHPAAVLAAYRLFGKDRLMLISDALPCAGLEDGSYQFGGQTIQLENGTATTPEGALAGGTNLLWNCVQKAVSIGIPFEDAVTMASETPARSLGLPKGAIRPGYDADLLVLENGDICSTMIKGEFIC